MAAALLLLLTFSGALDDDPAFVAGLQRYQRAEIEAAIKKFDDVARRVEHPADVARVRAWLGLCHAQLGHEEEARAQFRAAVRADKGVRMPAAAPASVTVLLEEERVAAAARVARPPPVASADAPQAPPSEAFPLSAVVGGTTIGLATATVLVGAGAWAVGAGVEQEAREGPNTQRQAHALADQADALYLTAAVVSAIGVAGVVAGMATLLLVD